MSFEMVLERLGPKEQEVVINKSFFNCGRLKDSDLVCLSLLVSREHCVFTKMPEGLFVMDLGSSNGVYVNGKVIRHKTPFKLEEDNIVGIGCGELTNLDESMFVYRIRKRVIISNADSSTPAVTDADNVSTSTNATASISKYASPNASSKASISASTNIRANASVNLSERAARKDGSKLRVLDNSVVPNKVQKTEENRMNVIYNNNMDEDDDIIEIIECTSTSNLGSEKIDKSNENFNSLSKSQNQPKEEENFNTEEKNVGARQQTERGKSNVKKETECSSTTAVTEKKTEKPVVTKEKSPVLLDIIDITDEQSSHKHDNDNKISHISVDPSIQNSKSPQTKEAHEQDINKIIKQEPEMNIEQDDSSIRVKLEPDWSAFSQIDLVEINDDDNIFPSSQLFDKTSTSIKQEYDDQNDNDQPHASLFFDDDDENIITILDSDDEDPCQIGEAFVHPTACVKQEPVDLEFVDVGEPCLLKTNETNQVDSACSDTLNVPNEEMASCTSLEQTTASLNKTPCSIEEPLLSSFNDKISNETSNKDSSKSSSSSSSKIKKKGLEIVEPHFMKSKKKSVKAEKSGKNDKKSRAKEELTSKKHSDKRKHSSENTSKRDHSRDKNSNGESSSKSKKHKKDKDQHSSSIPKKSRSEESSSKDKKRSHDKHQDSLSASSKILKNSKDQNEKEKNDSNISHDTSNSIQNASTSSNPDTQNQVKPKNRTVKVKVKVSAKSRGDMLCDSMQQLRPKPKAKTDAKKSQSDAAKAAAAKTSAKPNLSSFIIPRRQVPSTNSIFTSSQLNKPPCTFTDVRETSAVLKNATNYINLSHAASNINESRSSPPIDEPMANENQVPLAPPLKPSLTIPSLLNTTQKKVSFKENIVAVREFPIESGNQMRNIKDGLSLRSSRKDFSVYRSMELKIEDFLARIFAWEPVWLEQQQQVKTLPPIVKVEDMQRLPNVFNSYEEYYKKMEVLLLLETWQQLVKEYECTGNRYNTSVVLPCTIMRHSIRQMQTPNGLRYSMLTIHSLVSRNQLRLQNHPVYGDMIILEYSIKQGGVPKMRRAFAYVLQVQQQNSAKYLRSNELLCKYVTHPDALLTYTVQTRIIDEHTVQFDLVSRLRSVLYIRSHLRLIQGLQYVPHSALRDSILKVNVDEFQLEPVVPQQIFNYKLVTQEKLNERQTEAIIKFTTASVKMEPKIGLLVGPPGTGKSKVIANLVIQILYGDGRYVNGRPLRILVCAPSNAAIDEIVLRLLDVRAAIKDHRFKMVRIGRMESMHEDVKKISLSELAKREAQKINAEHHQKNVESVEIKKHKLKADIDALQLLVDGHPYNEVYRRDLAELRVKYKKLTSRSPEEEAAEMSRLQNSAKAIILQKADIIACTLSSCYTSQMESIFGGNSQKIATCIVDEATQCCEAETLIPLMLGVKSLILVGDPNQLPATVMSNDAKRLGLDRSLFTRAKEALEPQYNNYSQDCKDPIITLNIQYRMVNAISHWPNNYFYQGKLIDAVNYKKTFPFHPYRVLNLDGLQDDIKFSNTSEALFVGNLINCMMTCAKMNSWDKKITVGVITPYQNQKSVILDVIKEQTKNVPEVIKNKFVTEVNTIDSFQGQERDVIIMSCVRSSGIGFLSDQQRLCVALTRAKFTLIICGNFTTFQRDNTWKDLLRDARGRGVVARLNTTAKPIEIKPHIVRLDYKN